MDYTPIQRICQCAVPVPYERPSQKTICMNWGCGGEIKPKESERPERA